MTSWRIVDERHLESAFSGIGAERYGGRFNSTGRGMIYTSGSISLAMLEILVQIKERRRLMNHWCIAATFDDELVERADVQHLPDDWDARPPRKDSQEFGDRWLDEQRSVVLAVPSVVNPYEYNFLMNPAHPRFPEIRLGDPFPAPVDLRFGSP